jgi:hypothetical protein
MVSRSLSFRSEFACSASYAITEPRECAMRMSGTPSTALPVVASVTAHKPRRPRRRPPTADALAPIRLDGAVWWPDEFPFVTIGLARPAHSLRENPPSGHAMTGRRHSDCENEEHDEEKHDEQPGGPPRLPLLFMGAQVRLVTHHVPLMGTATIKS